MRQIKISLLLIGTIFSVTGCIEDYYPQSIYTQIDEYVVSGKVTSDEDYHTVRVSKTSSIVAPKKRPINGCKVSIVDSENNIYLTEYTNTDGEYFIPIDRNLITPGQAFKVQVLTLDGVFIESAYDTLRACPDVQDVYYERLDKPTNNSPILERGIQFKIDLKTDETHGKYFNWEIEETYEYTATYPLTFYYDGRVNEVFPESSSLYYCWATNTVQGIYPLSIQNLSENRLTGYKLHFVNNRTQKLMYLYSILVHQSAIGKDYYDYLNQIQTNSYNQGGLFATQPLTISGNLSSPSHPDKKIHGYFSVEGVKSRRFFFKKIMDIPFDVPNNCTPMELIQGFKVFKPSDYPVFLIDEGGEKKWVYDSCVDCRASGGTIKKPSFWPH